MGEPIRTIVLRVKLALSFKGLSYADVEEDHSVGKSELLLKSNPVHKKLPVLLHDGKPVCESQIIVQYIDDDEAFAGTGPSLLPTDPYQRALARFWSAYVDDKVLLSTSTTRAHAHMLLATLSIALYLYSSTTDAGDAGRCILMVMDVLFLVCSS